MICSMDGFTSNLMLIPRVLHTILFSRSKYMYELISSVSKLVLVLVFFKLSLPSFSKITSMSRATCYLDYLWVLINNSFTYRLFKLGIVQS
jgi:hypothetical protein